MATFKGRYKKKSYFEGWYFRNQNDNEVISFIPAFHIDDNGDKSTSIQVITNNFSNQIAYSIDAFAVSAKGFGIRIGKNIFTDKGILVDIETEKTTVKVSYIIATLSP